MNLIVKDKTHQMTLYEGFRDKCIDCDNPATHRCDWCNSLLCKSCMSSHSTSDCERIEENQRIRSIKVLQSSKER